MSNPQKQEPTSASIKVTDRYAQHLLQQTQVLTEMYESRQRRYSISNQVIRWLVIIGTSAIFCTDLLKWTALKETKIIISLVLVLVAWGVESFWGKKAGLLTDLIKQVKILESLAKHLYLSFLDGGVTTNSRALYHLLDMWLLHVKGDDHKAMIFAPSEEEFETFQRNAEKIVSGWIDLQNNERG